jgi:hypothetical protein
MSVKVFEPANRNGSLDGEAKFRASPACLVLAMFGSAAMIAARPLRTAARSVLIFGTKFGMLGKAVKSPSFTGWRLAATRLMAVGLSLGRQGWKPSMTVSTSNS